MGTLVGTIVATTTLEPATIGWLAAGQAMISPGIVRRLHRRGSQDTPSQQGSA